MSGLSLSLSFLFSWLVVGGGVLWGIASALPSPSPASPQAGNGTAVATGSGSGQCQPIQWTDIFWWFFRNYFLHALSVRSLPGESTTTSTVFKLCCLLVPYTGVVRGLNLILRSSTLVSAGDLQMAGREGALCMVVRGEGWQPGVGEKVAGCRVDLAGEEEKEGNGGGEKGSMEKDGVSTSSSSACEGTSRSITGGETKFKMKIEAPYKPALPTTILGGVAYYFLQSSRFRETALDKSILNHSYTEIHGLCELPPGYTLCYVPPDMSVRPKTTRKPSSSASTTSSNTSEPEMSLASSYNLPRLLFSLAQTVAGSYSLYQARGAQIQRYGYAAYGLTVIPYVVVSVINGMGSLVSNEYEKVFLVHSAVMDEMVERGGVVEGVVGTVDLEGAGEEGVGGEKLGEVGVVFEGVEGGEEGTVRARAVEGAGVGTTFLVDPPPPQPPKPPPRQMWVYERETRRIIRFIRRRRRRRNDHPPSTTPSVPTLSVPTLTVPSHPPFRRLPPSPLQPFLNTLALLLLLFALAVPYLITGILTKYNPAHSITNYRVMVMQWLVLGQVHGYAVGEVERVYDTRGSMISLLHIFLSYGSAFLGGSIVVCQMMVEFGKC